MATVNGEKKTKTMWELRYVSEYAAKFFPDYRSRTQVSVGPYRNIPPGTDMTIPANRPLGNDRPRADLVLETPQALLLIEGWILPAYGKVSQLMLYRQLLPSTPDLELDASLPVECYLLGPWENTLMRNLAFDNGIGYLIYTPQWIEQALESRAPRLREDRR